MLLECTLQSRSQIFRYIEALSDYYFISFHNTCTIYTTWTATQSPSKPSRRLMPNSIAFILKETFTTCHFWNEFAYTNQKNLEHVTILVIDRLTHTSPNSSTFMSCLINVFDYLHQPTSLSLDQPGCHAQYPLLFVMLSSCCSSSEYFVYQMTNFMYNKIALLP